MHIQVRYFAVFRDRIGKSEESLELEEGCDVAAAIAVLASRHAPIEALRGRFQVAVNQEMVPRSTPLSDGDELALIPPVAGGAELEETVERWARMIAGVPSIDRVSKAVVSRSMGGLVTFAGIVRRESRGRLVQHLEYEAYDEMATRVLSELCDEIEAEIPGCRVAVEHRTGRLEVGDVAVAIAAAAPHRAEAFSACRAMIDRLKERTPIWKKEVGPDGAEWVGLGP